MKKFRHYAQILRQFFLKFQSLLDVATDFIDKKQ